MEAYSMEVLCVWKCKEGLLRDSTLAYGTSSSVSHTSIWRSFYLSFILHILTLQSDKDTNGIFKEV